MILRLGENMELVIWCESDSLPASVLNTFFHVKPSEVSKDTAVIDKENNMRMEIHAMAAKLVKTLKVSAIADGGKTPKPALRVNGKYRNKKIRPLAVRVNGKYRKTKIMPSALRVNGKYRKKKIRKWNNNNARN